MFPQSSSPGPFRSFWRTVAHTGAAATLLACSPTPGVRVTFECPGLSCPAGCLVDTALDGTSTVTCQVPAGKACDPHAAVDLCEFPNICWENTYQNGVYGSFCRLPECVKKDRCAAGESCVDGRCRVVSSCPVCGTP